MTPLALRGFEEGGATRYVLALLAFRAGRVWEGAECDYHLTPNGTLLILDRLDGDVLPTSGLSAEEAAYTAVADDMRRQARMGLEFAHACAMVCGARDVYRASLSKEDECERSVSSSHMRSASPAESSAWNIAHGA